MPSPRSPLSIAPDDEAAGAPLTSWYTQGVTDGFGDRLLMFDNAATGPVELLRVRPDFSAVPGFESALRARFEQLSSFTHPSFAQARVVNHLENGGGLTVASTHVTGTRLSELFVTTRPTPGMHPASVRDAFGDLVAAVAELHRRGRNVAHGALGAERILLTFERQLVVTDYVFGEALERLNLTQEQLWTEFGLVGDPASGRTRLDQRGDLAQLGLLMLSLVIGRRVSPKEYPHKMGVLLSDFSTASDRRAPEATEPLRAWLEQALDTDGFRSADEAERAFLIRPRRPHSINLQIPLPKGLAAPRVTASAQTAPPPSPAERVSAATAPSNATTAPPVVPVVATPASSVRAPITTLPPASAPSAAAPPSPVPVPAPSVTRPAAIVEPPRSTSGGASPDIPLGPAVPTSFRAATPSSVATTTPLAVPPPPVADAPRAATPSAFVPPVPPVPLSIATPPTLVTPPPRFEAVPLVTQSPLAPASDASATPFVVLPPPREVSPASAEMPPSRFLRVQSTTPPTATSSVLELLMRPAAPPVEATPPVAEAPAAPAPQTPGAIQRPEPFGWISERGPAIDPDAVVASAARPGPTMSWLTVALGILVFTQAVIIGRLLSRQLPAPTAATTGANVAGKTALDSAPAAAASVDLPQDARNPGTPALPATSQTDQAQAGMTRTTNPPAATETSTGTQGAGAAAGNLGGVRVISPIPLQVMAGDQFLGSSGLGPVFTTPGTHELDFINNPLGFRLRQRVFISADRVVPLRINPPNGSLVVTARPRAQVWIDGHLAGDTPVTTSVPLGEHEVIFQNPQYGIKRQKAVVQVGSPTRVSASFIP